VTSTPDLATDILKHLRRLEANGSPGLTARVLEVFLRDTTVRLVSLRDAMARRDAGTLRLVAHTLQGSAAMVGAPSVAGQCGELVVASAAADFSRCEALVAALADNFDAIQRALALSYD
jgi:HPt (histidine-containing phosphotransfer) domain-containing protein